MNHELISAENEGILDLLHNTNGTTDVPEPFSRDIFLCDTCVWDLDHEEGPEEQFPFLKTGDKVFFFRESVHSFDTNAVRVETKDGVKLGYIYPGHSMLISGLLRGGKRLRGQVVFKGADDTWNGDPWRRIVVRINLQD